MMTKKISPLMKRLSYLKINKPTHSDKWIEVAPNDREWEKLYRRRWQYDKVIRTTHGVNCTGSCSWRVYVKDGIITWENQATDYPSNGPDMPEYEPRGCPRGASFSWYIYSPLRVKYPYVRGILLKFWREAISNYNDPVEAWKSIVEDKEKTKAYKKARGKGGLERSNWEEVNLIITASLLYTIKKYGPDRIVGFSPIPAMSMVSFSGGSRFLSLIGAPLLSFYDWYADLPIASPQIWGDQTDVPESSDWYNSSYLLIWGSNLPQTRTPDSHFMVEARYKGTKVVSISPDYAEFVKFADNWLNLRPGTDAALGMAMTHVILKEFYVDKRTEYFEQYVKKFTDLPFLVTLKQEKEGFVADRFLVASDIGIAVNKAEWKPLIFDEKSQKYAMPNGTIGHRWDGEANWNLHLNDDVQGFKDMNPLLSFLDHHDELALIQLPYFDDSKREILKRTVPIKKIQRGADTIYVTTVFDLLLANVGVSRGLAGDYPTDYNDPKPYTPAWQEAITGVDRNLVAQIAREFAQNAADSNGRSMIIMGAGINHWYNSDVIYRSILNLVLLTGCQGVNGGGWAHYVGQEKLRPLEGWQTIAMARDWGGPPRLQNGTSFIYFASDQWRYDEVSVEQLISPLRDSARYRHYADYNALAVRLGWLPSYPQFNQSSTEVIEEANTNGAQSSNEIINYLIQKLKNNNLRFAVEEPDNPINFPRVMFVWRANLIPSSSKGHEYILKHLLGTTSSTLSAESRNVKTTEIDWYDEIPEGKLDLLIDIDFRMSETGLNSDIILPTATWYEKYDISSTDMHPFIHPFTPAINPTWEAKSDWDIFKNLAESFSNLAKDYFPEPVQDIVTTPLLHDSPDEIAQPHGLFNDWKQGDSEPTPGVNLPRIHLVERDYTKVFEKMVSLGPLVKESIGAKGLAWHAREEYEQLQTVLGKSDFKGFESCPSIFTDRDVAEAILTLSSTTNGSICLKAWEALEKKTSLKLKDLAEERAEEHLTFAKITAQPQKVISSPVFSGTETGNRRYSPFTTNVERLIPWRTLTGRQHFYLDHEIIKEFGENLPLYKPIMDNHTFYSYDSKPKVEGKELTLQYLTPHYKWGFHTTFGDTLPMLTMFRGGSHLWLNNLDAEEIEVKDNDWVEMFNRYGVVTARAVVSHRLPRGVVYMYHAQDRRINVPKSTITNQPGGSHNSPTKVYMKPTHMIGGYAQLSYGYNYYGTTGTQRDLKVVIRKLKEVSWLEN